MDANELRALADALDRIARTHAMIAPDESEMQHQAAAYLRACADAQPVYRLAETDIYDFAGWLTTRDGVMPVGRTSDVAPLAEAVGDYIHKFPERFAAVPAAPQAEPKPTPASGDDLNVYKGMADSYRNDAEPTGAPYGIIDPDYGRVYTIARKLAWEEGYAIGLHGSFTRDLDLIVVPWAERACEAEHLIRRIVDATGLKLRDGVAVKPHGRRAWTLLFPAFGDPRFVDLSVMPRIGGSDAE